MHHPLGKNHTPDDIVKVPKGPLIKTTGHSCSSQTQIYFYFCVGFEALETCGHPMRNTGHMALKKTGSFSSVIRELQSVSVMQQQGTGWVQAAIKKC